MDQRFTLDRKSFEQFLAALSLVQQLKKQAGYKRVHGETNEPFVSLLQLQRAINMGQVDLPAVMAGVVKLSQSVLGASAAGVWLFRGAHEFSCCAQIGNVHDTERLGADILSQLANLSPADAHACTFSPSLRKASHYPGRPNSAAIAPVRINGRIIGAIASFATDFDAFASRDLDNLQFLAGLFEQAIHKGIEAGSSEAIALEHAALLQLLEKVGPQLNDLEKQVSGTRETQCTEPAASSPVSPARSIYSAHRQDELASADTPPAEHSTEPSGDCDFVGTQAADISVPGVGVRAALGDVREFTGEERAFLVWERLRGGSTWVRGAATACRAGTLRLIAERAAGIRGLTSRVSGGASRPVATLRSLAANSREHIGRVRDWRLKVRIPPLVRPGLEKGKFAWTQTGAVALLFLTALLGKCRTMLANGNERLCGTMRAARVKARSIRRDLRQAEVDLSNTVAHHKMRARIAQRRQQAMLSNSAELTGEALHHAGESLASAAVSAGHSTATALVFLRRRAVQARIALKQLRINPRALRRSASAVGVLAVMAVFVALQATVRRSLAPASASVEPNAAPAHAAEPVTTASIGSKPQISSHLEITDAAIAEALHELTRYEIVTLQRAAEYGDDEAAFQLGMAYETGYYVRQSCSKAAHWVKIAAESGNSAAAYNLGLRYREGDGLQADELAAQHWLRLASTQRYSPAKLAVAAIR